MTKKSSTVVLAIVITVILAVGVFLFIPFEYGSYGEKYSIASLMQKSNLFTDSVSTIYGVELDEDVTNAQIRSKINSRLNSIYSYYGCKLSDLSTSDNSLKITIPEVAKNSGLTTDSILEVVTARGKIEVVNDTSGSYDEANVILTVEHFKNAKTRTLVSGGSEYYVAVVDLTSEGKTAASVISNYVTFAIDGTVVGSVQPASENTLYFFTNSKLDARRVASYINTGDLGADLTLSDSTTKENIGGLVLAIALAVIVLACWIFLIVRCKALGLAGIIAQLFTIVIATVFAGLVHLEILNLFAVIGLLLGLALQTYFTVYTFDKISSYSDKTYAAACHKGFVDSNKRNLIVHAIVLAVGIILWLIPTVVTAPLGNVLVYLAVLSFVATMGLNRLFAKVVAPLVKTNVASNKK